tara:strand:- start:554 stop:1972 length:1419 start_codon:yes stop_codon:yes gene_type:complete
MKMEKSLGFDSTLAQSLCIGLLAAVYLGVFQFLVADDRISSIYFFNSSSGGLMQTLPIEQLRQDPIGSIRYLHMQPPLFDTIRAVIANLLVDETIVEKVELIQSVDRVLLHLYLVLYGLLTAIIFGWIKLATTSTLFASTMSVGWILYPTPIFLSTFLDGTLLSTVLISWMILEIWLFYKGHGRTGFLITAVLLCFFTRSFFQWYFFVVLFVSLLAIGMNRKQLVLVCLFLGLGAGGYLTKQYLIFGIASTSTFAGEHMTGMLWIEEANPAGGSVWTGVETDAYRDMLNSRKAEIEVQYPEPAKQYAGGYNTQEQWQLNFIHSTLAKETCAENSKYCFLAIWRSLRQNWSEYWHVEGWSNSILIDRLPDWYTKAYYRVSTRYVWFLILGAICFMVVRIYIRDHKKQYWWQVLGVILVPGFIFGICIFGNRFDWYEGGRLKFFLEPVYFVFVSSQIYLFGTQLFWKTKKTGFE